MYLGNLSSLMLLYLAEISVTLWESKSDLSLTQRSASIRSRALRHAQTDREADRQTDWQSAAG